MKLIDVSALKEWVENWFTKNRLYHPYAKNNNIPITELYDILKQMPSARPEQPKSCNECENFNKTMRLIYSTQPEQRWIPCSERLPEVHESGNSFSGIYMQSVPVLVCGICEGEENAQFHVVTYCDDLDGNTYWSTELDAFTITGVIAWMPLPEPYTERITDE